MEYTNKSLYHGPILHDYIDA